jgi:hypothetical protein
MKKIYIKRLWLFFILALIFSFNVSFALAQFDIPNPMPVTFDAGGSATTGMGSIFDGLGVDQNQLQNYIKSFNVSSEKKTPPQVSFTFTPTDPADGAKITATASPTYFMNGTKDLYFTWFLKQNVCDQTDDTGGLSQEIKDKCDLNGDGKIDIKDYKIKAMRILASSDFDWQNADYSSQSGGGDGYKAVTGGNDQTSKPHYCFIHDPSSGNEYEISCCKDSGLDSCKDNGDFEHLFPNAPSETTGDNHFPLDEEKFWHTDPNNKDTAGTGNTDEANVSGLGENNFSWNYMHGDEIGVVVEGISIEPTQYADSSYKTMWAFPKKMCDLSVTTTTTDDGNGGTVTTNTITNAATGDPMEHPSDLNECLYDNLVSPTEGGGASERLKIDLSYSPQSPVNDSTGENGDQITVKSSISNANAADFISYTWQVFEGDDPNPDSWGEPLLISDIPGASQTTGLGIDSFKFKMNFKSPLKKYLRVKVAASKNVSDGVTQIGNADVVIPVSSSSQKIQVFNTTISDNLQVSMPDTMAICTDGPDSAICPIAKGSIVGVKVNGTNLNDFMWTINGQPVSYKECPFAGCDSSKQGAEAYFPVSGDIGTGYTVNVAAINQTTGEKLNLSKVFKVVDPNVKIVVVSDDQNKAQPLLLGYYKKADTNGTLLYPDNSSTDFEAVSGYPIHFQAVFSGITTPDNSSYAWYVNEQPVSSSTDSTQPSVDSNGVLTVPMGQVDDSYTISVGAIYAPDSKTELALSKYWGVASSDLYAKPIGASANVKIVAALSNQPGQTTAQAKASKKILATIYSSLPSYLAFLFRIVLTAFVLLFFSGLVLSFFPEIQKE